MRKQNFLFGICFPVFRLQWNPIAPSKQKNICSKIEVIMGQRIFLVGVEILSEYSVTFAI